MCVERRRDMLICIHNSIERYLYARCFKTIDCVGVYDRNKLRIYVCVFIGTATCTLMAGAHAWGHDRSLLFARYLSRKVCRLTLKRSGGDFERVFFLVI